MATLRAVDWSAASQKLRDDSNTVNVAVVPSIDREGHRLDPHSEDRHIQLWRPERQPFDGASTYHDSFPGWQPPQRASAEHVRVDAFAGALAQGAPATTSTMKSHYSAPPVPAGLEPVTHAGSQAMMADSTGVAFNGRTSYAADYEAPSLPKRVSRSGVAWAEASYGPSTAFSATTTAQSDFTPKALIPRRRAPPTTLPVFKPEKPAPAVFAAESKPFEGQSSYRDQFPAHEIAARGPRAPLSYAPKKAYFMDQPKCVLARVLRRTVACISIYLAPPNCGLTVMRQAGRHHYNRASFQG
jgi:hypothetical protein